MMRILGVRSRGYIGEKKGYIFRDNIANNKVFATFLLLNIYFETTSLISPIIMTILMCVYDLLDLYGVFLLILE